jgi:hypothetical protein
MKRCVCAVALLAVLGLSAFTAPAGAIRKSQADRIAARTLKTASARGPAILFGLPRPLKAGTGISESGRGPGVRERPRAGRGGRAVLVQRRRGLARRAWFYWEDLAPRAAFSHPSRMLLVDDATGRVVRRQVLGWAPLINGRRPAFLRSRTAYESRRYRVARSRSVGPARVTSTRATLSQAVTGPPNLPNDCIVVIGDRVDPILSGNEPAVEQVARLLRVRVFKARTSSALEQEIARIKALQPPCTDIAIWLFGHGSPAIGSGIKAPDGRGGELPGTSTPAVQVASNVEHRSRPARRRGSRERPAVRVRVHTTRVETESVTGDAVRAILAKHPDLTFKLIVDSCFSGRWAELQDAPNLRVILTSSRSDQLSFSYWPNGTGFAVQKQDRGTLTPTGARIDINVPNPTKAAGFTNGVARGLSEWSASGEQRAKGEDLAKALAYAFGASARSDGSQITGHTNPVLADFSMQRPHAGLPPPPPPPGATPFTSTLELSHRHNGPGDSTLCVRVLTSPARPGATTRVRATGPGVVGATEMTVTLGSDGTALTRFSINQFGEYTAGAEITATDGGQGNAAGQHTVDGQAGTCPP